MRDAKKETTKYTVRNSGSNKLNCTEKYWHWKRSFKWGITWCSLTTRKANMGRGVGKIYLHRPTALLAWPVERPYQHLFFLHLFPKDFNSAIAFPIQFRFSLISCFGRCAWVSFIHLIIFIYIYYYTLLPAANYFE